MRDWTCVIITEIRAELTNFIIWLPAIDVTDVLYTDNKA